ncbi:hypothetical protein FPV67DRAFT_1510704 [Lyophyllum atratum]|nr:hypothetical protein FPV67DRAFT_1510704 [Lyophyllum atratum]
MPVTAKPLPYRPTVPDWVRDRWTDTFSVKLRYENDMYGIINTFLQLAFPAANRFIVAPQGLLRQQVTSGGSSSSGSDHSYDAMDGSHVASRSAPGHEDDLLIPDFLIYKSFDSDSAAGSDIIIAVVEVKKDIRTRIEGFNQFEDYLLRVGDHGRVDCWSVTRVLARLGHRRVWVT